MVELYGIFVHTTACNSWHGMRPLGLTTQNMRSSYAHGGLKIDMATEYVCVDSLECAEDGDNVLHAMEVGVGLKDVEAPA